MGAAKGQTQERTSTIGKALVEAGLITEEQLTRALRVQSLLEQPKQLGEVLTELGYVTKQAVNDAIAKYGRGMRLGEMLVEQGLITAETLDMALALQDERKIRLGEALLELGAINERTLLRNIAHQSRVPYIEPSFNMIEPALLRGVSPEYLERHGFIPFSRNDEGCVTVIVAELGNEAVRTVVDELFHRNVQLALGPEEVIRQTIEDFKMFRQRGARDSAEAAGPEDAVVTLVTHILSQAIDEGASDIHIEPMADKIRLRYRIDGVLVYKTDLPQDLLPKIISRLKILAECNITEHQRHQGGRIEFEFDGKQVDLRLSIYVTVHGESAVLRVLNKEMGLVSLDELGMNPSMLERYREDVLDVPTGVVLVTGPTGSGKTTTLYSSIDYCNDVSRKIITAEDPVEYTIDGIVQCSIYEKIGRTFEATLREIVRQDPDIIVMGEIRDKITAQVAIQAALTGHKVYSTFHTEDTIGGLLRLIDMEIETFLISSTVISVLAQRLLRRICSQCSTPYMPSAREALLLGISMQEIREFDYKKGRGCSHCMYTGYRGRIGAYELLILNDAVKEAILQKKPAHVIRQLSIDTTGLVSMREDAISKVIRGMTTFEEVMKHTPRTFGVRPLHQIISLCQ
ncbi:MAG: Flp pilus assembly complex ATPase component TadA [Candidatus Hydrogenedentes bacterium]|nr:Flp pilus assembly complex ATPase component TadA [Candidatus Hydrogenedentota bacterium]